MKLLYVRQAGVCLALLWVSLLANAQSSYLLGDWAGKRTEWADQGVELGFVYTGDYFKNTSGGIREESEYTDNVDLTATFDAEKLFDWENTTLFLYVLGIHGGDINDHVGTIQGISNIEAEDTWKLYEAWYERWLMDDQLSFKFGLYDLNSEFDVMETAGLFINPSFGISPDYSQSGENGPSIFPTTSLAARLYLQLNEQYYLQAALLDGIPGDPDDPEGTQIHFNKDDGLLIAMEAGHQHGSLHGTEYHKIAVGAWRYTEDFDDVRVVDGNGDPVQHDNNQGVYMIGEWSVYREKHESVEGLNLYVHFGFANDDVNQISHYAGAGMVYTGLFPGRHEDELGFAVAKAYNGDKYQDLKRSQGSPVDESETIFELSYRAQITPWLAIQPDFQWIRNPGTDRAVDDARVIGLRTEVVF